jgi:DNA end-binding protein Ku
MAPRSNWKGYLKLSLVSASIAIYPATSSSEKVRFNTGYAVGKDQFVTVEDDELANIAIELAHRRHREVRAEVLHRRPLP